MKEVICRIFVLALLTPTAFAGEFKTAGAYDGDAALVVIDSVKPFKAKETVTVYVADYLTRITATSLLAF
jgi:hypothetical protein